MTTLLTIGIPTYNRGPKLQHLLRQIDEQAKGLIGYPRLQILVSNNCSTDGTRAFLDDFKPESFDIRVIDQPVNVGGCRNFERLHRESKTKYTWVFSDDDVLFPRAIEQVLRTIDNHQPDVIRFSFVQPTGSLVRQFTYSEEVYVTTKKPEIARIISVYPKISSYVTRNIYIPPDDPIFHYAGGYGWVWLGWNYAVLQRSANPKVAVISDALASCDEDEAATDWVRFGFAVWLEWSHSFLHPFALAHAPELHKEQDILIYHSWVNHYDLLRRGVLIPTYFSNFPDAKPPLRFGILLTSWRLCWRFVRARIGQPWIYRLQSDAKRILNRLIGLP